MTLNIHEICPQMAVKLVGHCFILSTHSFTICGVVQVSI